MRVSTKDICSLYRIRKITYMQAVSLLVDGHKLSLVQAERLLASAH